MLFCGGGTWRAGCQPQVFVTTNGVDFAPSGRLNNRDNGCTRGEYALGGQASHLIKYGLDPSRPNVQFVYTAHYPGAGYGNRVNRYGSDPDNPSRTISPFSYSLNDSVYVMDRYEAATNGLPAFNWEAAGKDGLPEDKFKDGWEVLRRQLVQHSGRRCIAGLHRQLFHAQLGQPVRPSRWH